MTVAILTRSMQKNPSAEAFTAEQAKICKNHIDENSELEFCGLRINYKQGKSTKSLEKLKEVDGVVISDPEVLADNDKDMCLVEKYLESYNVEVISVG